MTEAEAKIIELLTAILATLERQEKTVEWLAGYEERAAKRIRDQLDSARLLRRPAD